MTKYLIILVTPFMTVAFFLIKNSKYELLSW